MIIAGTGHRPDKLGGYSDEVYNRLVMFASTMLMHYKPTEVISGMALGWDQALAKAALAKGIPLTAAIPFAGQEIAWPSRSRDRYYELLANVSVKVIVSEGGYAPWKMQVRNEWMVRRCNALLALWDGSEGGTFNCVKYADKKNVTVWNVWGEWQQFQPQLEKAHSGVQNT